MGTIIRKVEPIGPMAEILHLGGCVNYSLEMRAYLARIPKEQAERIVAELEYQHRPAKGHPLSHVIERAATAFAFTALPAPLAWCVGMIAGFLFGVIAVVEFQLVKEKETRREATQSLFEKLN